MVFKTDAHIIGEAILENNLLYEPEKTCPLCHTAFNGAKLSAYYLNDLRTYPKLYILHFCFCCQKCFLTFYTPYKHEKRTIFYARQSSPFEYESESFPDRLQTLSPNFVKIYNQALSAEKHGLTEICGGGYRKALEFLVKDYSIHKNPDEGDTIKNMPLSQCIKKYLQSESAQINALAIKSAWLGNDEIHYVKKHIDRDIHDLKTFISAIVYYISMELVTEDALSIEKIEDRNQI